MLLTPQLAPQDPHGLHYDVVVSSTRNLTPPYIRSWGLNLDFWLEISYIESNIGEWCWVKKNQFCYTATYLRCITCTTKAAEGLGWVYKTTRGLGDGSPGSRGGALVGGLGDEVSRSWRILKVVTSKFYAFFGSNSHTIHEIETLIIENENYEALCANKNYFHPADEKMSKTAGDP